MKKSALLIADINSFRKAAASAEAKIDYKKLLETIKKILADDGIELRKAVPVIWRNIKSEAFYNNFIKRLEEGGWDKPVEGESYLDETDFVYENDGRERLITYILEIIAKKELKGKEVLCLMSNDRHFTSLVKALNIIGVNFRLFCYSGATLSGVLVGETLKYYDRESIYDLRPHREKFTVFNNDSTIRKKERYFERVY